jgi:hypothetical protein
MAAPDRLPSTHPVLRPGLALWRSDLAGAPIVYDNPRRRQAPQLQARDTVTGGRARLLVCAEPDLHRGDLRAWMLPTQAPEQRGSASFTAIAVTLPG